MVFCVACGSPIHQTPAPAHAERRLLTVMFCDLVGSTELARRLDPEDFRELIRTLQETCARRIERFGGHVAQYLGDGAIARRHLEKAGVASRIKLRIDSALETLRALLRDPPIDLAFIDADKEGYVDYYEALLARLRPGGLILADSVLGSGNVVDPAKDDPSTRAIRHFIDHVAGDDRVMLPISDALTLARRRG